MPGQTLATRKLSTMTSLDIQITPHLARINLNRPALRNAFNAALIAELTQAFAELGARDDIRCIVLGAHGPAFCAGADLHWMRSMADYTRSENSADAALLAEMLRTIDHCPKPTIARVQGDAFAGGLGLIAACDIALSVDSASYCLSEVKLGLVPATIGPYLVRAIGVRAAQRYFLTAERFSAAEALRIGLVHEVLSADALDTRLAELVQALRQAGPNALQACKQLLRTLAISPLDDALIASTVASIADLRASPEGREGVQAFLDKRAPSWQA